MNIFNYFRKKEIDTVDASFYRKIDEWISWIIPMSGSLRSTRCIPDAGQVNDVAGKAWEWQRSCRKILLICC